MKLYHGTSRQNAKKIIGKGFRIPSESSEFFYGRGLYLKPTSEGAKMYGETVLEVKVDAKPCKVSKMEGRNLIMILAPKK